MKYGLIAVAISGLFVSSAMAQSSSQSAPPKNAALEAALSSCAASVAKDSNGRPNMSAMDACMTTKGFSKPPQMGNKGGIPPSPPSQQ